METCNKLIGTIFNVQNFSLHDGPGIRTTIFMKGCNLKCFWCHNPESWKKNKQIMFYRDKCIDCGACCSVCPNIVDGKIAIFTEECSLCARCVSECYSEALMLSGYEISTEKLISDLIREKDVFDESSGGVTFSGGEPLMQGEFLLEMLKLCKTNGIHTAIETAACVSSEIVLRLLPYIDLVFCDIKTMDSQNHKQATGMGNEKILENITLMSCQGANLCLRVPVIPGFNDNVESMEEIASFILSLPHRHTVELLPFHGMCSGKYEALNMNFVAASLQSPKKENMEELKEVFKKANIHLVKT